MAGNSLAAHRFLIRAALSGAHLFAWVFIFQYFYVQQRSIASACVSVLLAYALTHVVVILLTPFSAVRLRRGFKTPILLAVFSLSASFAALALAFSGSLGSIPLGITLFALLVGAYRAFYWIPYNISRESTPVAHREWIEVLIALLPISVGLYLTSLSSSVMELLYAAAAVVALSALPIFSLREQHEGFAWGYRQTFHELFDPAQRRLLMSTFLSGVESATLFVLWPITVFTLLDWSYPLLGVVMSLTLIFTLVARKLFSGALETAPPTVQPLIAASGWIMRLGVSGFVGAVLVDTYFHTSGKSSQRGIDVHAQEHIADNNTYVDEYTALKEMGMALGRIALCLIASILLTALALPHALALSFLVTALAAGYSVYHARQPKTAF